MLDELGPEEIEENSTGYVVDEQPVPIVICCPMFIFIPSHGPPPQLFTKDREPVDMVVIIGMANQLNSPAFFISR